MEDTIRIKGIIKVVKSGGVQGTVTDIVPTTKDALSAHLILEYFSSADDFSHRFGNTFQWLKELQEKENWHLILQDFIFLAWACK